MIEWTNQSEHPEGVFKSNIFLNDAREPELSIFIESPDIAEYAEKCVESLNDLPDSAIADICDGIIKAAEEFGDDSEQYEIESPRDILKYCWFTAVYVSAPENEDDITYIVEGEGDWGEEIGFVIKNGEAVYVGIEYFDHEE